MNLRSRKAAEKHYLKICKLLGLNMTGEKARTPERVLKALEEFTSSAGSVSNGKLTDPPFAMRTFKSSTDQGIIVTRDIDFSCLCEHHHLPFIGSVIIGYMPDSLIIGLSKMPRLVQWLSRCPTTQEIFTSKIADYILLHTKAFGVCVLSRAVHTCVCGRGPKMSRQETFVNVVRGKSGFEIKDEVLSISRMK